MSEISEQVSYPSVSSSSEWLVVIAFLTCLCVCLARLSACHIALNISLVLLCEDVIQEEGLTIAFILSSPVSSDLYCGFISLFYLYHSFLPACILLIPYCMSILSACLNSFKPPMSLLWMFPFL